MPLASYDYDYYEYVNGQRVNKTSYSAAPARRHTTTSQTRKTSTTRNVATTTTRRAASTTRKNVSAAPSRKTTNTTKKAAATKQTRRPTTSTTKKTVTSKKNLTQTTKKRNHNIDIPIKTSSKIVNKPKEMTLKKPKTKKSAQTLKDALIKTSYVVVFFAIAFAICYRYSLINEEFSELKNVKKEYENIQTVNEQIEVDIESKTDLIFIENYAKYQLGMQKPSDSQKRYINIEREDAILTPITISDTSEKNWFEKVCEEAAKILE